MKKPGSGRISKIDSPPSNATESGHAATAPFLRVLSNNRPGWFIHWILSAIALLLVVANILPGIQVDGFGAALIAALVIGLVSATVGLILKVILLPFIVLSLGIVYFIINGLMLEQLRRLHRSGLPRASGHPYGDARVDPAHVSSIMC